MRQLNRNIRTERTGFIPISGSLTLSVTVPPGPSWEIKQLAIKGNSALEPTCSTFIGTNSAGVFISTSLTGNGDTDDQPNVTLRSGDSICAVWSSATGNAVMTFTIIYDEVAA